MLNEDMIGKIAAGEVVERPAAAIKELVENSLDAGATAITVEIREGGIEYFRVTDNGCGIEQSDIRLAFERHATSKIGSEKDLYAISTLGFRGEALASIAAVAHVTLTTRTAKDETGIRVKNDGGRITSIEETACPVGTTVAVKELFFNTPVRKEFLKKPAAETNAVSEMMMHMILSREDVSFRFVSNDKVIYHSAGDNELTSVIYSVYGSQILKTLRKVDGHANGLIVNGYVGIGENARGNRSGESFFINGRIMRSGLLSSALENACRERVMIGKFPMCVLHVQIPFDAVDVNVHPNKLEVRFRDEKAVSEAIQYIVGNAIRDPDPLTKPVEMLLTKQPTADAEKNDDKPTKTEHIVPKSDHITVEISDTLPKTSAENVQKEKPTPVFKETTVAQTVPKTGTTVSQTAQQSGPVRKTEGKTPAISAAVERNVLPEEKAEQVSTILPDIQKPIRIMGALFNTFILAEYDDQLLMIDQHAVHERLLFDKMMDNFGKQSAGQILLTPILVGATHREQALLEENRELLEGLGLIAEPFSETDIAVRSIPVLLGSAQTAGFVREIIDELVAGRSPGFEKKRTAILQMACKRAVKGGDPLTEDEIRSLIDNMMKKHVTPTCPHGRPLVVSISHHELDRKFRREQ